MTKIAYLDCSCGICGDMALGALVDAGVAIEALNEAISSLGLPDCRLVAEEVRRRDFRATKVNVLYPPEHAHRHLHQILAMIDASRLSPRQKNIASKIFTRLAEAEAKVHGIAIEKVHFHEVGAADAIADIVGTVVGFELLGVGRIVASPVPTGWGTIKIAHGECSIPAPATAELLHGVPLVESAIQGELTTPTGAAILSVLADGFGPMPPMTIEKIGCGAGYNDWAERANILRIIVGDQVKADAQYETDQVSQLETNLDDLSGELIGYCIERLWDAGALDVYTTAISMKKNRPGVLLSVLCRPADASCLEEIIFQETSTLGIRRITLDRHVLPRKSHTVETIWGPVEGKTVELGNGVFRFTPEYESCRRIALEHNLPLRDVYEAAQKAFDAKKVANAG
jgi:pyridinium-3,5-bisthiocarboxylic acid mononucleotide nickel chelatase